jgi:hypothetical protein
METLILVAKLGGATMFARIGVMRALNRHVERVFDPTRKDHHWGRRKLKRDHEPDRPPGHLLYAADRCAGDHLERAGPALGRRPTRENPPA